MRTACFVDGYNLYYGLLANTPYKWLDLGCLLQLVLRIQDPASEIVSIDYFTAPVLPALARRGVESHEAQMTYIRALKARGVRVTEGHHRLRDALAPTYERGRQPSRDFQCPIWKLEEKETDVNIALSMYRTAAKQQREPAESRIQQIVLVSADTDMTPALKALKADFPDLRIGVVIPHREDIQRDPPGSLINNADWTRRKIKREELERSLLPDRVPTKKKPAVKPSYW